MRRALSLYVCACVRTSVDIYGEDKANTTVKTLGLRPRFRVNVSVGEGTSVFSLTAGGSCDAACGRGCAYFPGGTNEHLLLDRCGGEPLAAQRLRERGCFVEHVVHVSHTGHVPL